MSEILHGSDWFRLDNAAKIYPPAYTDRAPEVFRVGVTLSDPVRLTAMQRALDRTIARCPYYQVHLKRGLFWYYLERHQRPPTVELLEHENVSHIRMRVEKEQLFRVFVRDRLVRIDFSHVLTDGFGALRFLATLVAEYLRQCGIPIPSGGLVLDPDDPPAETETEDAYQRLNQPGTPGPKTPGAAYHLPGPIVPGYHRTLTGRVPADRAVEKAREFKVSLTELLAGIYIHAILQIWKASARKPRRRRVICLEVPADMRRFLSTETMRNFSLFVLPGIDLRLGDYSLPDIIRTVHHTMRLQLDPREIRRQVARNVGGEKLFLVRVIPLLLKDWYLSSLHNHFGGNLESGVISNLGPIDFPEEMSGHIRDVMFVLGPNPTLRKNISIASYRGHLNIAIGSVIESRELERLFFTTLTGLGLPVRLSEQTS